MSQSTETRLVRWRYLGRRELSKGGLGACYQMPDGEHVLFRSVKPAKVVGGIYEVKLADDTDGLVMVGAPRFAQAPSLEDADVRVLEAEDRAAVAADALRRREAKARAESAQQFARVTLGELREIYGRAPYPRRAALLAQAIRHITST